MDEHYQFILAGGGAAGLSLAYELVNSGFSDASILIVDMEKKTANDRTWCFWIDRPFHLDPIVHRRWKHMWFHGPERSHRFDLDPYEYRMIRGQDFYRHTMADLENRSNVTFFYGNVAALENGGTNDAPARIEMETGEVFTADWIFDSLFLPREFVVDTKRYRFLKQHFLGWTIRTQQDHFDPNAVTLFDLRIDQNGAFRFMYILPFSPREALVEYTFFSSELLTEPEYRAGLETYLDSYLTGISYEIVEEESGIIPMTDQPFPRRSGNRIMRTGTKGGRVKGSTGFAFMRTVTDAASIVRSLKRRGHPFDVPDSPGRYHTFDAMLLSILDRNPDNGRDIFVRLFEKNPLPRIWRFLDETGSLRENIALMASVPWFPFIAAWFEVKWRRLVHRGQP
ncbi:MAG: lycopene cyclase family protein [Alkalispirochaeta sp.]